MQLLGHKDIRVALRYVQVIQPDLQREYHLARQNAPLHRLPTLPIPAATLNSDLAAIHQAIAATRHVLEMYRRSFPDEKIRRKLQRLTAASWRSPITWITSLRPKNEERLAGQLTQPDAIPPQLVDPLAQVVEHGSGSGSPRVFPNFPSADKL
jgi:hypothetical protein